MVSNTPYRYKKIAIMLRLNNLISKFLILNKAKLDKIDYRYLQKIEQDLERLYNSLKPSDRYIHQRYICPNHIDSVATESQRKDILQKIKRSVKNEQDDK